MSTEVRQYPQHFHNIYDAPEGTTTGMDYILGDKKRKLDIMISSPAGMLALPAIGILGSLVYLQDGHKPFVDVGYSNEITGQIEVHKIRTMVPNAAELETKITNGKPLNELKQQGLDPRITPLGMIIRKTSLDELPQIFSVINGSTSMVGPRYYSRSDWQNYLDLHDRDPEVEQLKENFRKGMKGGITGMYVLNGRSALPIQDRVRLDNEYAEKANWLADLRIIAWTFPAVLRAKGAK